MSIDRSLISFCLNRADLIRVHDGTDSGTPTIAVLCNQGAEVEVLSTGPDLYVEFVANSEWPGQGFKAMFQFQPLDDAPHPARISLDELSPLLIFVFVFSITVVSLNKNVEKDVGVYGAINHGPKPFVLRQIAQLDKVVPGAVTGNPRYSVIGPAVSATSKCISLGL
ncbi:suppressor of lurcher protein 1 isoform X1 [Vespula maculifrons]|uniref:Suppressor of lurcher protein 1 isoform X1 n=1 Tax=Vespula maculifrons TaxID=7453 RepID=A0ABD2BZS4_VESMC